MKQYTFTVYFLNTKQVVTCGNASSAVIIACANQIQKGLNTECYRVVCHETKELIDVDSNRPVLVNLKNYQNRVINIGDLSKEETESLCTLVTRLVGELQYRAIKAKSKWKQKELDGAWKFWNNISNKIASSMGFESFMVSDSMVDNLLKK